MCGSELQKTAENPQLQFIFGRRFSCRGADADSHGHAFQQTMVIPRLQFLYEVIDVPGMQVVQVLLRRCPLCATTGALKKVVIFPFVAQRLFPWS